LFLQTVGIIVFSDTLIGYSSQHQSIWYFFTYLLSSGILVFWLFSIALLMVDSRQGSYIPSAVLCGYHKHSPEQNEYPTSLAYGLPGMEVEQELILTQPSRTVLYELLSGL
jgi:hypothetical protein